MSLPDRCPLCGGAVRGAAAVHGGDASAADLAVDCARCGRYVLTRGALAVAELADPEDRARVADEIAAARASGRLAPLQIRPESFITGV
jgi:hypothetical protein